MAPPTRSRLRRAARVLTLAVSGLFVLVVAAYLLRGPLFGRLAAGAVTDALSDELGGRYSIQSVEGGWITDVVLVGLRTEAPPPSGALRDVGFDRAHVSFSLMGLFTDPVRAVHEVSVEGLRVVLETEARDTQSAPGPGHGPGESVAEILAAIPRPLPQLDVRGVVLLRTAEGAWSADEIHATGGGTTLHLDIGALTTPLGGAPGPQRLRGDIAWEDPRVVRWTSSSELAGTTLSSAALTAGPGRAWRVDAQIAAAGTSVVAHVTDAEFAATTAGLDVARLPEWMRTRLGTAGDALPRGGSVDASIRGDATSVRWTVAARDLAWAERALDRLAAEGTWTDGRLDIATLDGAGEGVTVTARGVVIDPESPLVVVGAGDVAASTPDAAALALRLGLDEVAARLPARPTSVAVRLRGSRPGEIEIESLTVDAGATHATAAGTVSLPSDPSAWRSARVALSARATISMDDARRAVPGTWAPADATGVVTAAGRIDGELARPEATATVAGTDLVLGGQRIASVSADASIRGTLLTVARLKMSSSFADVSANGAIDVESGAVRTVRLDARASDLAAASSAFPSLPALTGEIHATASLDGSLPGGLRGEVTARGTGLSAGTWNVGAVDAAGAVEGATVRIARVRIDGPLGVADASGTLDTGTGAFDLTGLRATIPDLRAITRHVRDVPDLAGAVQIDGSLRRAAGASWEEIEGEATVSGEGIVVEGIDVAALTSHVRARNRHVELLRLTARGAFGEVAADGTLDFEPAATRAVLRRLDLRRGGVAASLARPVELTWSAGNLEVASLDANLEGGGSVRGSGRLSAETIRVRLDAVAVELALFSDRLAGAASAHVEIDGPRDAPTGRVSVSAPAMTWDGEAAAVTVDLVQDERGIQAAKLVVDAGEALRLTGTGFVPVRVGVGGPVRAETPPPAELSIELVSTRPGRWIALATGEPVAAESVGVTIVGKGPDLSVVARVRDASWTGARPKPFVVGGDTTFELKVAAGGTVAHVETAAGGIATMRGDARVRAAPDWTDPVAAWRALRDAAVEGSLSLDFADLAAAAAWIPDVRRVSGRARGELTLSGTVGVPEWSGIVEANDLSLLLAGDVPALDQGTARLRLAPRRIEIDELTGRLGFAPVTVTGAIDLPAGASPVADLHVAGKNVLVLRSPDLRLRADVDLVVTGTFEAIAIAGTARITHAVYSRPMDLLGRGAASPDKSFQLFSLRTPPLSGARLDVGVTADRTLRIENELVDAEVSLDVRLRGTGEVPEPSGWVTFHGAVVTLPFTTLDVERGQLEFEPGSPFAPAVRALARATVKGYELNVAVSGHLPDVDVHVASSPPLSQANARLLLATGATPGELEREGIAGAALARAGTLLGGAALEWVSGGRSRRSDSVLNRVRIEIGRDQSEEGVETVTAEFRMSERWFLVAERDRFQDVNLGIVWRVRFQ